MLRCMPFKLFREWQHYYEIEPWGEERADLRMGIQTATVANMFSGKGHRPLKPSDFMPEFDREKTKAKPSFEVMRQRIRAWGKRCGVVEQPLPPSGD